MRRLPQCLQCRSRAEEPRSARVPRPEERADAKLEEEPFEVQNLGGHHQDRDVSEGRKHPRPRIVIELRVDSVEQVHVRGNRPGEKVVHRRRRLGKDLPEARNRFLPVVGDDQITRRPEAMELPLERRRSDAIRRESAHALSFEPRVDCTRPLGELRPILRTMDEFVTFPGKCKGPAGCRPKPVPCLRVDEVVTHDLAVDAEVVVVADRELQPYLDSLRRGA